MTRSSQNKPSAVDSTLKNSSNRSDELDFGEYIKIEDNKMSSGMMLAMFIGMAIVIVSAIALAYTFIYNERFPVSLNLNRNFILSREEAMIDDLLLEIDTDLANIDPDEDFKDFDDLDLASATTTEDELSDTLDEIDEILIELNDLEQDFNDFYESDLGL